MYCLSVTFPWTCKKLAFSKPACAFRLSYPVQLLRLFLLPHLMLIKQASLPMVQQTFSLQSRGISLWLGWILCDLSTYLLWSKNEEEGDCIGWTFFLNELLSQDLWHGKKYLSFVEITCASDQNNQPLPPLNIVQQFSSYNEFLHTLFEWLLQQL